MAQLEDYDRGELREEEILTIARGVFFQPLAGERRYSSSMKIRAAELKHDPSCASQVQAVDVEVKNANTLRSVAVNRFGGGALDPKTEGRIKAGIKRFFQDDEVTFATAEADISVLAQGDLWSNWKRVCLAVSNTAQHEWLEPDAVDVTPLAHTATCGRCGAALTRYSARVVIQWMGRTLTREYMLGGES